MNDYADREGKLAADPKDKELTSHFRSTLTNGVLVWLPFRMQAIDSSHFRLILPWALRLPRKLIDRHNL